MKAAFSLLLGILFTVSAFAQGRVAFANTSTTLVMTNSGSIYPPGQQPNQVGPITGIGQYTIGLYIAPEGTTTFTIAGTATNDAIRDGRFNGGNPFTIAENTGQTIAFQIRAWQTSGGATYETCCGVGGYRGSSAIGFVTPAIGNAPTPALFGTSPGQVGGFALCPGYPEAGPCIIPEPSSTLLALIGAAVALGVFRYPFRRR